MVRQTADRFTVVHEEQLSLNWDTDRKRNFIPNKRASRSALGDTKRHVTSPRVKLLTTSLFEEIILTDRLSVCLPVCLPACLSVCLFACLSPCLSTCLSVSLPACLFACLSAYLPARLLMYVRMSCRVSLSAYSFLALFPERT